MTTVAMPVFSTKNETVRAHTVSSLLRFSLTFSLTNELFIRNNS